MTTKEKYVEQLRELADFFEGAPDNVPRPSINETVYIVKEDIPTVVGYCSRLEKRVSNGYLSLIISLDFGTVNFRIAQGEVCERKVVGQTWQATYHVEGHFVDQVEWECKPILKAVGKEEKDEDTVLKPLPPSDDIPF